MQVIMSPGRKIGKTLGEKEKGEIALYVVGTIGTESNAFDARFKHTLQDLFEDFHSSDPCCDNLGETWIEVSDPMLNNFADHFAPVTILFLFSTVNREAFKCNTCILRPFIPFTKCQVFLLELASYTIPHCPQGI